MSLRAMRPVLAPLFCVAVSLTLVTSAGFEPGSLRAAVTLPYESEGRFVVAPGVVHDHGFIQTDTAGRQAVYLLEVDTADPVITFEASLSNERVAGLERTTAQANRKNDEGHRAVAGINADFWGARQEPNGVHIEWGELVTSAASARPTFGVEADGHVIIGSPLVNAEARSSAGAGQRIARVNQARPANQLVLYTPRFGNTTATDSSGTEVLVSGVPMPITPTGEYDGTITEIRAGAGNTPIGEGEVVLSATGPAAGFLNTLSPGETVALRFSITPGWQEVIHAIGGGQYIVRNGVVDVQPHDPGFADVTHPRTAIGITIDGDVVMAAVDGRQPGYSIGVRLDELGELMVSRGVVTAINLDGGGSTTMAVRLPGDDGVTAVNRGSDGFERAVSNSLLVFSSAPTGPLAFARVIPPDVLAFKGVRIDYAVKGQDAAYNAVAVPPSRVRWSASGRIGRIDSLGRFVATRAGQGAVHARIGRVRGEASVQVVEALASLEVHPSYVIVEPGSTQAFTLVGRDEGERPVRVDGRLAEWAVEGPIGTIDRQGVLTAGDPPAGGRVTASAGGATGAARVDIGRAPVVLEDFEDISDMQATGVAATASLTNAMRPDPVRAGTRSGRLSYSFVGRPGTSAAYAAHSPWRDIDGRPTRIGIWLYGDGSRHWVRGHLRDGTNTQLVVNFTPPPTPTPTNPDECGRRTGGIDWIGWKYLDAPIPADTLLPLKWERVYVVETVDVCDDASAVYLDDLRAVYGDSGEDLIGPSVSELIPEPGAVMNDRQPTIGGTIRDNPGGSGVAPDSVRLIVDGAQVPAMYDSATGQVRYTPPAPLGDGVHHVLLDATDNAGNPALPFGDWTFTVRTP